jgi:uncharacterized protein YggU (UPF0235/DUF167 family)
MQLVDGLLVVRVASPAVQGRATDEARRTLADALGLPPTRVRLMRGVRSQEKVFLLESLDPVEVRARLASTGAERG